MIGLPVVAGVAIYAHYATIGCGPMSSNEIENSNQVRIIYPVLPQLPNPPPSPSRPSHLQPAVFFFSLCLISSWKLSTSLAFLVSSSPVWPQVLSGSSHFSRSNANRKWCNNNNDDSRFSSVSSELNAAASTTYDDIIKPLFPSMRDARAAQISKGLGNHYLHVLVPYF